MVVVVNHRVVHSFRTENAYSLCHLNARTQSEPLISVLYCTDPNTNFTKKQLVIPYCAVGIQNEHCKETG